MCEAKKNTSFTTAFSGSREEIDDLSTQYGSATAVGGQGDRTTQTAWRWNTASRVERRWIPVYLPNTRVSFEVEGSRFGEKQGLEFFRESLPLHHLSSGVFQMLQRLLVPLFVPLFATANAVCVCLPEEERVRKVDWLVERTAMPSLQPQQSFV